MAFIDASLDTLMLPALPTFQNPFGTKKLEGGLSTEQCTEGLIRPFTQQRPFTVSETSETSKIEAHCSFVITAADIELTLADATFTGCECKVINMSNGAVTLYGGVSGISGSLDGILIPAKECRTLVFFEGWHTSFVLDHPVGTLFWTNNEINPHLLYGGQWKRIQDVFILAAGTLHTVNETGGESEVLLTKDTIPSHFHEFTPTGTVESHHHGLNNHTHTVTGTAHYDGSHTHPWPASYAGYSTDGGATYPVIRVSGGNNEYYSSPSTKTKSAGSHSHSVTGTARASSENTTEEQPLFQGEKGETSSIGGGAAHNNMPPYLAKYCWERVS